MIPELKTKDEEYSEIINKIMALNLWTSKIGCEVKSKIGQRIWTKTEALNPRVSMGGVTPTWFSQLPVPQVIPWCNSSSWSTDRIWDYEEISVLWLAYIIWQRWRDFIDILKVRNQLALSWLKETLFWVGLTLSSELLRLVFKQEVAMLGEGLGKEPSGMWNVPSRSWE